MRVDARELLDLARQVFAAEARVAVSRPVGVLVGALHVFDPEGFGSDGQVGAGGTWAEDFGWYGPGGIGSATGPMPPCRDGRR